MSWILLVSSASGQSIDELKRQLKVNQQQPIVARSADTVPTAQSKFGALAIDERQGNAYGWAIDYTSYSDAEQRALNECGPQCTVVLRFFDQCGAYVVDAEHGSTVYGWGKAKTQQLAQSTARFECLKRGGKQCVNRVWGCTSNP